MPPRDQPFPAPGELTAPLDWARKSMWTPFECAALSMGMEPRSIERDPRDTPILNEPTAFSEALTERLYLIEGALAAPDELDFVSDSNEGHLIGKITPIEFVRWCQRKEIDLTADLVEAVERIYDDRALSEIELLRRRVTELEAKIVDLNAELARHKKPESNTALTRDELDELARAMLKDMFADPGVIWTREKAKIHCTAELPGLSGEGFKRAWGTPGVVPASAKDPGAKPKLK